MPGCAVYSLSGVSDPTPRIVTTVSYPPLLVTVVPGTKPLSPDRPIAFDLSNSVPEMAVTAIGAFCKSTCSFSAVTVTSSSFPAEIFLELLSCPVSSGERATTSLGQVTLTSELSAGECAPPTAGRMTGSTSRLINKPSRIDFTNRDMTILPDNQAFFFIRRPTSYHSVEISLRDGGA